MSRRPLPDVRATRVLVVHVNFAVAIALAQRLIGSSAIILAGVEEGLDTLARRPVPDVVVLDPYLENHERAAVLAACEACKPRPRVLQLADELGSSRVSVVSLTPDATLDADHSDPNETDVDSILLALEPALA
jgi:hypothetical protein